MLRRHPSAYVRLAQLSELPAITRVLTRAFARDPDMNWCGSAPQLVADVDSPTPSEQTTMRNLSWYQSALCKAIFLDGGVITVVAIPFDDKPPMDNKAGEYDRLEGPLEAAADEQIAAVSLWMPPGRVPDMGPITFLRCGMLQVMRGWGLTGLKVGSLLFCRQRLHGFFYG